jgi:hypothetical protein
MLALAFAAAFIAVTAIILFLFNAERQVFNPESYKRALLERQIYDQLPALIAGQLASSMRETSAGAANYFRNLTRQDWEIILAGLLTPEWLRAQTEHAIDQYFAYLDSVEPAPRIIVSLVEVKVRLQGEPGMRAVMQMLRAQPDCTQEQLLSMAQEALFGGIENMPLCMPPQDLLDEFRPGLQAGLNELSAQVPNEVDLGSRIKGAPVDAPAAPPAEDPRPGIRRARVLIRLSPLLPAALILLVTVFAVRSFRDWLLWWGIPLLLAGLAALALGLVAAPLFSGWIEGIFSGNVDLPPELAALAAGVGQDLAGAAIRPAMLQGGLLALLGLAMSFLGLVIRPPAPSRGY